MGAQSLKLVPVKWSDAAAARLGRIAAASEADLANWQAHVTAGRMYLLEARLAGAVIGFVIWSIEDEPSRRAVIVNAAAIDPIRGMDMTETIYRFARDMATRNGATVLRFWTRRTGLLRKLAGRFTHTYVMEAQL